MRAPAEVGVMAGGNVTLDYSVHRVGVVRPRQPHSQLATRICPLVLFLYLALALTALSRKVSTHVPARQLV